MLATAEEKLSLKFRHNLVQLETYLGLTGCVRHYVPGMQLLQLLYRPERQSLTRPCGAEVHPRKEPMEEGSSHYNATGSYNQRKGIV